jgi:hypothetical protein
MTRRVTSPENPLTVEAMGSHNCALRGFGSRGDNIQEWRALLSLLGRSRCARDVRRCIRLPRMEVDFKGGRGNYAYSCRVDEMCCRVVAEDGIVFGHGIGSTGALAKLHL